MLDFYRERPIEERIEIDYEDDTCSCPLFCDEFAKIDEGGDGEDD